MGGGVDGLKEELYKCDRLKEEIRKNSGGVWQAKGRTK